MSVAAFPPSDRNGAIVLVHGAWVGEWSWAPVLPALRRSGRAVHAVSLRGHGLRRNESGPDVTLADHVDDVVAVVETFDLDHITLVGHSYGGRVITQAQARLGDRVGNIVYLDAHAPLGDAAIGDATGHLEVEGGMIPFSRFVPDPDEFGGDDAVEWFMQRVEPQSAATLAADFATDLPDSLHPVYVAATAEPDSPFRSYAAAADASPAWRYVELASSHWLMVARPVDVASVILDAGRHTADADATLHADPTTPTNGTVR